MKAPNHSGTCGGLTAPRRQHSQGLSAAPCVPVGLPVAGLFLYAEALGGDNGLELCSEPGHILKLTAPSTLGDQGCMRGTQGRHLGKMFHLLKALDGAELGVLRGFACLLVHANLHSCLQGTCLSPLMWQLTTPSILKDQYKRSLLETLKRKHRNRSWGSLPGHSRWVYLKGRPLPLSPEMTDQEAWGGGQETALMTSTPTFPAPLSSSLSTLGEMLWYTVKTKAAWWQQSLTHTC
jgi:hypothetical protein